MLAHKLADSGTQPPPELLLRCFKAVKLGAAIKERLQKPRDSASSSADAAKFAIFVRSPTIVAIMATATADEMRAAIFATRKDEAAWAHLALLEQHLLAGARLETCESTQLFQSSAAGLTTHPC